MQHIQFGDGRIVYNPAEYGYEYHYYHKDHLGNIRQVFRAESTTTYMATMEPENETQEMQQFFHNLSDSRSIDARYNQTEGGRAVAYLDASRGRDYGPVWSKELAQGDSLHAAVLGMLYDPKEKPKLKNLLTGIGRQNALRSGLEGANLTGTSSLGLQPLWLALQLARQLEKAPVPESYLGYILYDQDSIRYDSGRVEISRQAFTNPEELALDITASQGGFVEVYVYNSSDLPVWYDQFSISSSQAVIIQENHYYPFGMQIAGLELDLDSKNRYLYNGKELQDDHDLDWHDYGARMYDAQIGRFHSADPLADEFVWQSAYSAFNNNPILYIDPDGRAAVNSQGCCGGPPFDGLINYAASKVRQVAYDLSVATVKAFNQLTTAYAEHKLDQAVNSNDPFTSSVALTTEFVTGLGPVEREFGGSHPFTQSLAESNMTTEALTAFNSGYQDYLAGNREDIPSSYRVDFSYGLGGDTGPFKEFFKDGKFTAAQFTGTANYMFSLDKKGNLNIGVYDTKTEYSFMYHALGTDRHSRSDGQIMGETTQYYNFTIPLDQVQKRVEE
ncbi:RHS repeat-associated core domain-containing protein [Peijinzhouia sedimentorum]